MFYIYLRIFHYLSSNDVHLLETSEYKEAEKLIRQIEKNSKSKITIERWKSSDFPDDEIFSCKDLLLYERFHNEGIALILLKDKDDKIDHSDHCFISF